MNISVIETLRKAITTRYKIHSKEEVLEISKNRKAEVIIGDSLAASMLANPEIELPENCEFISPNLAAMFGSTHLSFDYLVKELGIDMAQLKVDLEELQKARMNLVIVGYGGYSINTLEFLYQFCIRLGIKNLFEYIAIWEDDNLTYTNCLRIYPNLGTPADNENHTHKFAIFNNKYDNILSEKNHLVFHRLDTETYTEYYKGKNVTLLGAPDFETRKLLEDARFIFGGHSGDEVGLINNPVVNSQLTTESYGTINPTTLFLNLIKGAAELPKALLNKAENNTVLFEYNCKKELDTSTSAVDFLLNKGE